MTTEDILHPGTLKAFLARSALGLRMTGRDYRVLGADREETERLLFLASRQAGREALLDQLEGEERRR